MRRRLAMIDLRCVVGRELEARIDDLAKLRIDVFRAFPYLYDGDAAYERAYLSTYATAVDGLFVLALDGETVVGVSTGVPLDSETESVKAPWRDAGIDPATVFYFGESVLLPPYRGHGLGHRFFDLREAHARALDRFAITTFCAVARDGDHPARPAGYRPLHAFWQSRGYAPQTGLHCRMAWKEVGSDDDIDHRLDFWARSIDVSDAAG